MNKILGNLFLIIMLVLPTIALSAVDIIVRTDRNPVHMDESFQLVFEANGGVDNDPDFSPLKVLLDVVRQSESSNISLINGSMSRSKTWTLTVMAKAVGDIQIPTIHFGDDKSAPLLISVKKADQAQMGSSSFFVNLDSDIKSSIEQAQIIATVRVFSDKSLNEISLSSLQFNHGDVVVEPLGDEKSFQTKIQGKAYLVIEQKVALFPQKPGPLVIQPVLAMGEVRVGKRSFFADPASKSVRSRSDSLRIDVLAKPDATPLWLPAKSLTLKDEWLSDPSEFTVGEPITRVLTLSAQGLTAAQLPELTIKEIDSVKMYPDQDQLKDGITDLGVSGIRQEKIAYIPSKSGEFTLPAMEIPWWNTETRQWQKAQIPAQIITVKASEIFVENAPVITKEIAKVNNNEPIDNIEDKVVSDVEVVSKDDGWWKWIALIFALAWIITLWFLFRRRNSIVEVIAETETHKPTFNLSRFKTACEKRDVKVCKESVIDWANNQFLDQDFTQLSDLKNYVDDEFYNEVKQLESMLYSSDPSNAWQPDLLYSAVLKITNSKNKQDKDNSKTLKSLHLS